MHGGDHHIKAKTQRHINTLLLLLLYVYLVAHREWSVYVFFQLRQDVFFGYDKHVIPQQKVSIVNNIILQVYDTIEAK